MPLTPVPELAVTIFEASSFPSGVEQLELRGRLEGVGGAGDLERTLDLRERSGRLDQDGGHQILEVGAG